MLAHTVRWRYPPVECHQNGTVRRGHSEQIDVGHLVVAHQPMEVVPHARQGWKQFELAVLAILRERR